MNNRNYKPRTEADNRKNYYTLLQVGKADLGWDDEFYYGIWLPMQGATLKNGKYSASTMTIGQLSQAVETMKKQGFKIKHSNDKSTRALAGDAQSQKIRALWLEMHNQGIVRDPSESSLAIYVKRLTGVEALQWLDTRQASGVIEALKKWQKRVNNTADNQ
ncbi:MULTISPECIES: gp16 family protein [Methylobacter]